MHGRFGELNRAGSLTAVLALGSVANSSNRPTPDGRATRLLALKPTLTLALASVLSFRRRRRKRVNILGQLCDGLAMQG
jgi:hypothetical protein